MIRLKISGLYTKLPFGERLSLSHGVEFYSPESIVILQSRSFFHEFNSFPSRYESNSTRLVVLMNRLTSFAYRDEERR